MPLITGSIYLFGQILSFALPVSLLIAFATFFYRQFSRSPQQTATGDSTPSAASTTSTVAPGPSAAPSGPYSDH